MAAHLEDAPTRRFCDNLHLKETAVPPTYVLARDHLQRAATILQGADQRSRQLRHIIERTIGLMEEIRPEQAKPVNNVLELNDYRHLRQ